MKPAIIWGGTGHAKVVRPILTFAGYRVVAVFDNRPIASPFPDVGLFEGWTGFDAWHSLAGLGSGACSFVVAIGGTHGRDRLELAYRLTDRGLKPLVLVHQTAMIAGSVWLEKGCQVLLGACLGQGAELGEQTIVNTGAQVDHDCRVGKGCHLMPGCVLAGEVVLGNFASVGSGAVVLPRLTIGEGAIVGAGAVVTRDVPPGVTVVGNPARVFQR